MPSPGPATALPPAPSFAPSGPHGAAWTAAACLAVVTPTLLAFNVPPSATFLNQAAALIGWGVLCLLFARAPGVAWSPRWRGGEGALHSGLALMALAAASAPSWAGLPWTLALSTLGALAATALVAWVGAELTRAGRAPAAFQALCVALLAAGVIGVALGAVQVFLPQFVDGTLIASIVGGRAAGNLRQPNHLSSLLLWATIALVWLHGEGRVAHRAATGLGLLLTAGIVLTGSRTGLLGVLMLLAWGWFDGSLHASARRALKFAPLVYALSWMALTLWAHATQQGFAGESQFVKGDISSSRFAIWSDTLTLIARHPWFGVGWGEFNFAWSLTPFPERPTAFFDHTHNLPLQLAVELGLPLALAVLALFGVALVRAWRAAARCADPATARTLRAALVMVLMMAVHSQFEYPLWYAYFLLPAAFAFGLCLGGEGAAPAPSAPGPTWPLRAGAALLIAGSVLALADYLRVVSIYAPTASAPPLAQRIADGKRSWLFGHHADYAAATTEGMAADPARAFERATHYLLDTRLMMAWARALDATGQADAARHVAARLREFRNPQSEPFFEVCDLLEEEDAATAPFQCQAPSAPLTFEDFRR